MTKRIYIKESHIHRMVLESVRGYLTEGRHTKINQKAAAVVKQKYPDMSDEDVKKYLGQVDHELFNGNIKNSPLYKLKVPFTKEILDKGYDIFNAGRISEIQDFKKYIAILKYLCKNGKLNPSEVGSVSSYQELLDRYGQIIDDNMNTDLSEKIQSTEANYTIERLDTREDSVKYGDYSGLISNSSSRICYTQSDDMWDNFTENDNDTMYVCLKDGWKDMKPVHDPPVDDPREGNPYDEYGRSMIFVIVRPDGSMHKSNTRWNHMADYGVRHCDFAFEEGEIEKIIKASFRDVFIPKALIPFEERHKDDIEELQRKLDDPDIPLDDIVSTYDDSNDGVIIIEFMRKKNIISSDRKILSDKWFDFIYEFSGDIAIVGKSVAGKGLEFNLIRKDGVTLCDTWYDSIWDPDSLGTGQGVSFASIKNGSSNEVYVIDRNGKRLYDICFESASDFIHGWSVVKYFSNAEGKTKFNFLKFEDGSMLSENGYDYAETFNVDGIAKVGRYDMNGAMRYAYINAGGDEYGGDELMAVKIDKVTGFKKVARKKANGHWEFNYLRDDNSELMQDWSLILGDFDDYGVAVVNMPKGVQLINADGEYLCNEWYYSIYFYGKICLVSNHARKRKFISHSTGKPVSPRWYNFVRIMTFGRSKFVVSALLDGRNGESMYNLVDENGNELLDKWYVGIDYMRRTKDLVPVMIGYAGQKFEYNFLKRDLTLACATNFDVVVRWDKDIVAVKNGREYKISPEGKVTPFNQYDYLDDYNEEDIIYL